MKNGKPLPLLTQSELDIFNSKVDRSGGPDSCWLWKGAIGGGGYGAFYLHCKPFKAHRLALALSGKQLKPDDICCHKCHSKLCCNPKHLMAADQRTNVRQDLRKANPGRGCNLTYAKANAIRRMFANGTTRRELADRYSVSLDQISRVLRNDVYENPNYAPVYKIRPLKRTRIKGYSISHLNGRYRLFIHDRMHKSYPTLDDAEREAFRLLLPSFII